MKVILQADVKTLGKKGQVIEVAEGYGRNYLLPRGLAIEATGGNIKILAQQQAADAQKKSKELAAAQDLASRLEKVQLVIKTKMGESGRLFGSVTSKEISDVLQQSHGIVLDKRKVELKEPIKSLGEYELNVKIHPEVQASLKVTVRGE